MASGRVTLGRAQGQACAALATLEGAVVAGGGSVAHLNLSADKGLLVCSDPDGHALAFTFTASASHVETGAIEAAAAAAAAAGTTQTQTPEAEAEAEAEAVAEIDWDFRAATEQRVVAKLQAEQGQRLPDFGPHVEVLDPLLAHALVREI